METHVKERLTGALILVALLVIVVPEILPGPVDSRHGRGEEPAAATDGPPLRSYTMELGAAGEGADSDQSALAPQAGAAQSAASGATESSAPAKETESTSSQTAAAGSAQDVPDSRSGDSPASAATPAPAPASEPTSKPAVTDETPVPSGSWWVQVGSFSQAANAQRLVQALAAAGFRAQVSSVRTSGKELFRVRAGPVADRASAEALKGRLAAAGHKGSLVAP